MPLIPCWQWSDGLIASCLALGCFHAERGQTLQALHQLFVCSYSAVWVLHGEMQQLTAGGEVVVGLAWRTQNQRWQWLTW